MDPFARKVYHRKQSRTRTPEVARVQEASGEIWGTYNRDLAGGRSIVPSVDAFEGPLGENELGIEFVTDVPPDPDTRPKYARWTGPRPGVTIGRGLRQDQGRRNAKHAAGLNMERAIVQVPPEP